MQTQLTKFGTYLLVRRGLADYTIHGYVGSMRRFLSEATICPSIDQIESYVASMYTNEFSYSHIVNTSLAIERYMEFIGSPLKLGRPKKPRRIIIETLSEAEIARLIGATKNIRERTILALLAYSGIRAKELCQLLVCDVDFASQSLNIRNGKGAKDRSVCIPPECSALVMEYLQSYPRSSESYLFTTLQQNHKYHTGDLRKLVRVVAARNSINRRIYPHLFRHSLATNMLNRGAGLITIQQQLGHVFLETTMIYLHQALRKTRNEYQMYVPNYI